MTVPPGPLRLPRLTLTFEACAVAASSTTLKDTTSFLAPNVWMHLPSQTLLTTAPACPVARSSSWVTLSPPSLAQIAVSAGRGRDDAGAHGARIARVVLGRCVGARGTVTRGAPVGARASVAAGAAVGDCGGIASSAATRRRPIRRAPSTRRGPRGPGTRSWRAEARACDGSFRPPGAGAPDRKCTSPRRQVPRTSRSSGGSELFPSSGVFLG